MVLVGEVAKHAPHVKLKGRSTLTQPSPSSFRPYPTQKMPVCHALTRNGHPCRGHGAPDLCHMHRDYFTYHKADQEVTDLVNPYMTYTEREWLIRMLKSPLYKADPKWLVEHFKGLAAWTQHSMTQRAIYLYELYVLAGVLQPFASLQFWRLSVASSLRVIAYCGSYNAETNCMEFSSDFPSRVSRLFRHFVKGLPPHIVLPYLLSFMGAPFSMTRDDELSLAQRMECSAQIWTAVLDTLLPTMSARAMMAYPLDTLLAKIDAVHADKPQSIWHMPGMHLYLAIRLKAMQLAERKAAQERFAPLCEELMMAAWHPTRVERWLEAGIQPEDM